MDISLILKKIKEYDIITIYSHKRPDGDCIGSSLGLKNIIETTFPKKQVYSLGDHTPYLRFLGELDNLDDETIKKSLAIVVDTATQERVADQRFKLAKEIIKIDHHIVMDQYGDINWVHEEAPAACQMITYFLYKFRDQLLITKQGAQALYAGLVTDSGGFRYRGVTETTFQMAAFLVSKGADLEYIDRELSKTTFAQLKYKGYLLSNIKRSKNGVVYFLATRDIQKKFNLTQEDTAAAINAMAGIEGCPVWVLFIELENSVRVRVRSNQVEIASVCNKFPPGGGHDFAAGCHLDKMKQHTKVIDALDARIVEVLKKNN